MAVEEKYTLGAYLHVRMRVFAVLKIPKTLRYVVVMNAHFIREVFVYLSQEKRVNISKTYLLYTPI